MLKLRIGAIAAAGVLALAASSAAGAKSPGNGVSNPNAAGNSNGAGHAQGTGKSKSSGSAHGKANAQGKSNHTGSGDSNAGDVWVDNVGQPSGPGHEMDPHLGCTNINLWGSGLADTSDPFTIAGWPPSGHKKSDYSGTWNYQHNPGRKSGAQIIAVINVSQLIANAQANGDTPTKQGYHFKLNLVQDPQKHKTFWVDCTSVPSPSGAGTGTSSGSSTGSFSGSSPSSSRGVRGSHKHKHKLVAPARHHKATKRSVAGVGATAPAFTG